ncbi:MAG: cytochrome c peroxidase [Cruoricaptor ignavus]|nr:cytochrome c peroxidase [Cruoricaptor ignavus]
MKNIISYLFILFLLNILVVNCLSQQTIKPESEKIYSLKKLRELYSSGNSGLWPKPNLHDEAKATFQEIGHLPEIIYPTDNPYSKEKELLGKTLFFDPRLSKSKQIACASCHDPELAWTDNRTVSFGHDRQTGARNAMTILNSAHISKPFWDGRAESLEAQAQMPIQDPKEMNEHIDIAVETIANIKGYEKLFAQAFGNKEVTKEKIGKAIATFERGIKSGSTKFDMFIDGKSDALSDDELMGLHLFRTKAQCINCHNSGYFSNNEFINDGTGLLGSKQQDLGLYIITKNPDDAGKFRVPTLREVTRTGPWMHNGAFTPLRDVLTFYNAGNPEPKSKSSTVYEGVALSSKKSNMLKPLNLTNKELDQLEAFLGTLSSRTRRIILPELPK